METTGQLFFGTTDYILLAAMLSVSMGIGVFFAFYGRKRQTKIDYLLGSRRMGAIPVCMSVFATFQSAISLLGTPAEVYTYGTMTFYSVAGPVLSYVACLFTAIPLFYPLKLTSVNEYLERRYNSRFIRLLGTVTGIAATVTYMSIALLSPGLALQTAVGLPLWLSLVVIGSVGTLYTAIGGIKSVIWTDVFQTFIIFGGIIVVLVKGCFDVGGIEKVFNITADKGRVIFDDVRVDPRVRHSLWGLTVGSFFYWSASNFGQSLVQRISATKSVQQANLVFLLCIPLALLYKVVLVLTGLVMVAYFFDLQCDPMTAGYVKNSNQMMPYFVMHSLSFLPGLPGLYIATIFSGALSTLSSGINSLAANTVEDLLGSVLTHRKESTTTAVTKCIVVFYGAVIIGLAYLARIFTGPVTQITYSALGATSGPVMGLFALGATFPQANKVGAVVGVFTGLVISMWITIGSFLYGARAPVLGRGSTALCTPVNGSDILYSDVSGYGNMTSVPWTNITTLSPSFMTTKHIPSQIKTDFSFYDLSYLWTPMIGSLITVACGLTVSIIYRHLANDQDVVEPRLLFPLTRRLWGIRVQEETVSGVKELTTFNPGKLTSAQGKVTLDPSPRNFETEHTLKL
ncbi:sodium-dependent multivitamin transporter-like [Physella acuta]|uniref:sodium-dependent multivitamin transporter-like n=1 Tax=Physella acuta TaxID=109671 RepID=UPI0027DB73BB|nr:sodium-dependent multivitamin transporter-like [Physella acuta]